MSSLIEVLSHLVIGTVESVSSTDIRVVMDLDAPQSTALNTGMPVAFPRLNGYLLIPNETGATVAYITWMGIESSPYPRRNGVKDLGLVDLPFPQRKITLSPIGTLSIKRGGKSASDTYKLSRGVRAFPSVGDQVLIPTAEQVSAIVGARSEDRRVKIGTSPMALDANIMVDPDKLFGRHLAVLGNTGSGKSCSVAGMIRWAMTAAEEAIGPDKKHLGPNARFIVLDPNGEYAKAFADRDDKLRLFRVPPVKDGERSLNLPAWLWNGHEWSAVAHAQPGAQRPLLLQGLRELKSGANDARPREVIIRGHLNSYLVQISSLLRVGRVAFTGTTPARMNCARLLQSLSKDCSSWMADITGGSLFPLSSLKTTIDGVLDATKGYNPAYFDDFRVTDLEGVQTALNSLVTSLPEGDVSANVHEDVPSHFDIGMLAAHLEHLATQQGGNVAAFISTLGLRIRGMVADARLGSVINSDNRIEFSDWLTDYIGGNGADNGEIGVIDLSLVPSEMLHIVVSVLARLIFESLQRYRRNHPSGKTLPTVLVLEEAHNFVRGGTGTDAGASSPSELCREIFERIAREGRKFGLGLVVSSQRPSELSPTLLAQCNTFLLHRIVNDADQKLVSKLVPDNIGGLLKELPSLPSGQAILLGWAAPIPVLVEMNELPFELRPQSDDPDYWDVWTRETERPVNWHELAKLWVEE